MELEAKLEALATKVRDHREVLQTEEAAKNALVMPFLTALGYDVFDPSEVIPEFTADIGTKKGEKVDYAICDNGKVNILIECKAVDANFSPKHVSQLYRYFSVTNARFAILTNGCDYHVFTDLIATNKMDDRPFFSFSLTDLTKADILTLSKFQKGSFDEEGIVRVASSFQLETSVVRFLKEQMVNPGDDFIRLVAGSVHDGRATEAVRSAVGRAVTNAFIHILNDRVKDTLETAISSGQQEIEPVDEGAGPSIITTPEEIEGFHIVRAIASQIVDPKRIAMRDAQSYCAILLDDNNRRSIARLHFNSATARYIGTFTGKDEERHSINDIVDVYKFAGRITARIKELEG